MKIKLVCVTNGPKDDAQFVLDSVSIPEPNVREEYLITDHEWIGPWPKLCELLESFKTDATGEDFIFFKIDDDILISRESSSKLISIALENPQYDAISARVIDQTAYEEDILPDDFWAIDVVVPVKNIQTACCVLRPRALGFFNAELFSKLPYFGGDNLISSLIRNNGYETAIAYGVVAYHKASIPRRLRKREVINLANWESLYRDLAEM